MPPPPGRTSRGRDPREEGEGPPLQRGPPITPLDARTSRGGDPREEGEGPPLQRGPPTTPLDGLMVPAQAVDLNACGPKSGAEFFLVLLMTTETKKTKSCSWNYEMACW
ncbi:uncharacterized protein EMH_0069730 [Eimeria mitis]|uniref:Uncharacterized protein n=1 Tax=Eimeria mitis TaxID=44415 RepID=U6K480_9EIME|nr:uncharacterized protein EMH_0069730 [Eimeria mitis]CDJ31786.1 hypothetical protein EMH_0069730 [Eimeria mitis]